MGATAGNGGSSFAPPTRGGWKLYLGVFGPLVILYSLTAQRGAAWQDSGCFQWRIVNFDVAGELGLALSHPLVIVLGRALSVLPLGPLAWRMNLVSVLAAAAAAANVSLLVRRLMPRRPMAAWLAGGFFGLAHTAWWLGTICESQALLAALFTAQLHVLVSLSKRPGTGLVSVLGLLSGLALAAHNLALLALPACFAMTLHLCFRRRLPWRAVPWFVASWLIGAGGLVAIVIWKASEWGLAAAIRSALFGGTERGGGWRNEVLCGSGRAFVMGLGYILYNFPNLALPLMIAGLWRVCRQFPACLAWAFVYLVSIYFLFAVRYGVADQFMFFLPFYAMVAVLAGVGLGHLVGRRRRAWLVVAAVLSLAATPAVYAAAPLALRAFHLRLPGRADLPFRDPAIYWLLPWKGGESSAQQFARSALRQVPPGGVIIADGTGFYPLVFVQRAEETTGDVRILRNDQAAADRVWPGTPNVFVVSDRKGYHPAWLEGQCTFRKGDAEVLFRVDWQTPSTAPHGP